MIAGTRRVVAAIAALGAIAACGGSVAADTHRFVPDRFYNTFSFAHPPVLRIKAPGASASPPD